MTCNECQLQIFGREPSEAELDVAATAHLGVCEDCRELDREVRLNSSALAELREEAPPIAPLARRSSRVGGWVATVAAAAAAVFVLWGPREYPPPPDIKPPVVAGGTVLPKPEIHILNVRPVVKPKARIKRQPKPKPVEQPMLVKFITDDPEVVVYWIVDPPNQGEPGI